MPAYDFSDVDGDDFEGGGGVVPGFYRCEVADVKDNQYQAGNIDVEFRVTHGPYKGAKIYDTVIDPANAQDTEKSKKCAQRLGMYLTRTGLYSKEELAGKRVDVDWMELVGREVFVKAVEDTYTKKDTGDKKTRVRPAFDGVYALDDERVPEDVRKKAGVTAKKADAAGGQQQAKDAPAEKKPAKKPAGKQRDLSDL